MESQHEPTEGPESRKLADETKRFAERILAEPEYRKMVVAVLCASGRKEKPVIVGETLLQRLIGPPLQAKAIVTLFQTVQGAEYPGFCRDLFETAKILTALGAFEEGIRLFTVIGLFCFGGEDFNDREREEIIVFLEAGSKLVKMSRGLKEIIQDYLNGKPLQPSKNAYRLWRQKIMEKIRNPALHGLKQRLANLRIFVLAVLASFAIPDIIDRAMDEDSDGLPIGNPSSDSTADTLPVSPPDAPAAPSAPKEPDKIHPRPSLSEAKQLMSPQGESFAPSSYARTICSSDRERKTFGFEEGGKQVRVTCGQEENGELSLEIAERSVERTVRCIDVGRDDIPDACGLREAEGEELEMFSPPPEDLSSWFGETLREAAKRINH